MGGMGSAIERVDDLCDAAHGLARLAERCRWPAGLREALAAIASDLELLAGELDGAPDLARARQVVTQAQEFLALNFSALGEAISSDLIRAFREAAQGSLRNAEGAAGHVALPRARKHPSGSASRPAG